MERRYLAATLALVATFAIFSGEFRSGHLARLPHSRAEVMAELACAKHYVAQQLMAKLQPYVDHGAPERAQIVADLNLNLPDVAAIEQQVADAQAQAAQHTANKQCEAAIRARQATQQVFKIQIHTPDQAQRFSDLAVVRAQDLSERAQEWNNLVSDRTQEINANELLRAQEITARAMELAQREVEKSQRKMAHPSQPGTPIHINFVTPTRVEFVVSAPAVPEPPSVSIF